MDYNEIIAEFMQKISEFLRVSAAASLVDFTQGELKVLNLLLYFEDENLLPSEISSKLFMSSAHVASILNSLEKKGLVIREMSPHDRRKILVSITEPGLVYVKEKREKARTAFIYLLNELGEDDSEALIRIIGRIPDIISKIQQ